MNAPAVNLGSMLRLPASKQMPRKLVIDFGGPSTRVLMFGAAGAPLLSEASSPRDQVRLRTSRGEQTAELFVGLSSFNVTESEAQIISGTFGPRGLKVETC